MSDGIAVNGRIDSRIAVLHLLLLAEAQLLQIKIIEQSNEELPPAENTYLAKIFQSWSNLWVISEVLKLLVVYSTAVNTKQNNDNCYRKCNNENHRKQTKLKNEKDFSGKWLIQLEELKRIPQQHMCNETRSNHNSYQ